MVAVTDGAGVLAGPEKEDLGECQERGVAMINRNLFPNLPWVLSDL